MTEEKNKKNHKQDEAVEKDIESQVEDLENANEVPMHADGVDRDADSHVSKDKYMRALADYQNLLKQKEKEKTDLVKYANEQLIMEMLPVYDNLRTSMAHIDEASEKNGWAKGIEYVIKQFGDVLKSEGVEEIATTGEKFDHNTMEAVSQEETGEKGKDGLVAKGLSAGYKLNGKVIKAARVSVYKVKD